MTLRRTICCLALLAPAACTDEPRTPLVCAPTGCPDASCPDPAEGEGEGPAEGEGEGPAEGEGEGPVGPPPPECNPATLDCAADKEPVYGLCVHQPMVSLPGGSFAMGTDSRDWPDARPLHDVTVGAFSLDRYETTNALWAACVRCQVCDPPEEDSSFTGREPYYGNVEFEDHPVVYVSWQQARAFCEGRGGRLPTEAEWELAARGAEDRDWPWGSQAPSARRANFGYRLGDTSPAGDKPEGATPDGVEDLAGNVWEWVADTWESGYDDGPVTDPTGPTTGPLKVVRGGSFGSAEDDIRPWARTSYPGTGTMANVGFRCAR